MQILCLIILIILVPEIFIFAGKYIFKFFGWMFGYLILGFSILFLAGTVIKHLNILLYIGVALTVALLVDISTGYKGSRFLKTKFSPRSGLKPKDAYEQWCAKVLR